MWRSRWAAIGAAVAVGLGAGGLFVAEAAPGPAESTIVTVTPERILETRDPVNLGLAGPFTLPVAQKLQVTGSIPTATATKAAINQLPIARSAREGDVVPDPAGSSRILTSVSISVPVDGLLQIVGSTYIRTVPPGGGTVDCRITSGAGNVIGSGALLDSDRADDVAGGGNGSRSTNIALPVTAGDYVINLVSNAPLGVDP